MFKVRKNLKYLLNLNRNLQEAFSLYCKNELLSFQDIIITETIIKVISNHQNGFVSEKPLKKIKKVVDYGGYYLLLISKWEVSQSIFA